MRKLVLLPLVLVVACKRESPGSVAAKGSAPVKPTAALVTATAGTSLDAGASDPCAEASYAGALATGQKLLGEKKYAGAIAAYDDAVRARPFAARARAERGYAKLLAGLDPDTAIDDLEIARARTPETDKPLASSPSAASTTKLGAQSKCRAAIRVLPPADTTTTRAEACTNEADADGCKGRAPWTIDLGHPTYHHLTQDVVPLTSGGYATFGNVSPGGNCRGGGSQTVILDGAYILVASDDEGIHRVDKSADVCFPTEPQPFANGSLNDCVAEAEYLHTFAIFDRATGKGLALVDDYTRKPKLSFDGTTLVVEEEGCIDRVALDGTAKRLP